MFWQYVQLAQDMCSLAMLQPAQTGDLVPLHFHMEVLQHLHLQTDKVQISAELLCKGDVGRPYQSITSKVVDKPLCQLPSKTPQDGCTYAK